MQPRCKLAGVVGLAAVCLAAAGGVSAQEVSGAATTTTKAMDKAPAPVTQAMLDAAASDAKNWIHPNGSYDQSRYYAGTQMTPPTSAS